MSSSAFSFSFTHRSGRHVIAQNYREFLSLLNNEDYVSRTKLGVNLNFFNSRVLKLPFIKGIIEREAYWRKHKQYESIGTVDLSDVPRYGYYIGLIYYVREMRNFASVRGDQELYDRCLKVAERYENNNLNIMLIEGPKEAG